LDGFLGLVHHLLDRLFGFAGGLIDLAFAAKAIIIRHCAGRFLHSAFDFICFASHDSTPISTKKMDVGLLVLTSANRVIGALKSKRRAK
jgi:hypothetical protein